MTMPGEEYGLPQPPSVLPKLERPEMGEAGEAREEWLRQRMLKIRRLAYREWEDMGGLTPWETYFQERYRDVASWFYERAGRVGEWWGGYQPQPRLARGFQRMVGGLEGTKPYLDWFASRYPSLAREFEATLPTFPGFLTREEAAKQARGQEKGWAAWLRERRPELREEWASLGWRRRGERPYAFAPRIQTLSF